MSNSIIWGGRGAEVRLKIIIFLWYLPPCMSYTVVPYLSILPLTKCCRFTDFTLQKLEESSMSIDEVRRSYKKLTFKDLESIHQKVTKAFEVRLVGPTKLHPLLRT